MFLEFNSGHMNIIGSITWEVKEKKRKIYIKL